MVELVVFFLPIILFLGILTSFGDIKKGKIKNKWLVFGLLLGLLVWFLLILLNKTNYGEFFVVFLFSLTSLIVGFVLWLMKLWSAGDAKLYAVFVLLIPLSVCQYGNSWPIITILTNIFLPVFLFLIIKLLINSKNKEKLDILKNILKPKNLLDYFLFVFGLIWLINILFGIFGIELNYFVSILLIIGVGNGFERLFKNKLFKKIKFNYKKFLILIILIRIFFQYSLMLNVGFWFNTLVITMVYAVMRMFLFGLSSLFIKKINLNELKPGMLLPNSKYAERLTEKQVIHIKKVMKNKKQKEVLIEETIPFAPFIFIGVLITILINGDMILILKLLFFG